jgi:hypothetical protein
MAAVYYLLRKKLYYWVPGLPPGVLIDWSNGQTMYSAEWLNLDSLPQATIKTVAEILGATPAPENSEGDVA